MEEKIKMLMNKLNISYEEAYELMNFDKEVDHMTAAEVNSDLTAEQKKVVKKMKNIGQKTISTPKKPREKRADEEKEALMKLLKTSLMPEVQNIRQPKNGELTFTYRDRKFKIILSAPRM